MITGVFGSAAIHSPAYVPYTGGLQPPSVTDLVLWFDADDTTTMYSDIARTTIPSFKSNKITTVQSISDKSASLNHATVALGTDEMKFTPHGSRAYLEIPIKANFANPIVMNGLTNATRVCVLSSTSANRVHPLWNTVTSDFGLFYPYGYEVYDSFSLDSRPKLFDVRSFATKTSSANSEPWLDVVRVDTNTTSYYLDDLNVKAYESTASPNMYSHAYTLGSGNPSWSAGMFEMLIYNRVLSDTELTDIVAYVNDKWGVGAIAPTGTP